MLLQVKENLSIEDVRRHPAELVEKLRALLAAGAPAEEDPHRRAFYELQNGSRVYYIHISPVTGRVWLLATWVKEQEGGDSRRAIA